MTKIQAYNDGYDAYLRLHNEWSDVERRSTGGAEPHSPYVDDPSLYRAWLEGWKGAGGCSRLASDLRNAQSGASAPSIVAGLGAVWPVPPGTATGLQFCMRSGV